MQHDEPQSGRTAGPLPSGPACTVEPESRTEAQREAARLDALRMGDLVKEAVLDALAALHLAERDVDFQLYVAGLRKLLAAGLLAKGVADTLVEQYGPDAVTL